MAIEIIDWHYSSTPEQPEAPFFLRLTDGRKEYTVPLPGLYVPGDDVRGEFLAALAAIEDLARMLQTYAADIRKEHGLE